MDPARLIESGGLIIIGLIVFAETGLLIGFFLPGDTLLLAAGILSSQGKLPLGPTLLVIITMSIAGNITGYYIGLAGGRRLFNRPKSLFFDQQHLDRAEAFYDRHGRKTILLARFVPIVRTFAAVIAGVGRMPLGRFMAYNVLGGLIWGGSVTLLGYWFGSRIPHLDRYLLPIFIVIVILSFGPTLYHILTRRRH